MSFEDKSIRCADCSQEFVFSASEQQFFAEKGFTNEPKRCPACRRAKRDRGSSQSTSQSSW
ncbi:MAG: zinc-ribbon domain-containing protein [Dehalococcoidia bacterium]|nr:zinc-ribbon domain-containing protein [Dehalococcoidia bacterium]